MASQQRLLHVHFSLDSTKGPHFPYMAAPQVKCPNCAGKITFSAIVLGYIVDNSAPLGSLDKLDDVESITSHPPTQYCHGCGTVITLTPASIKNVLEQTTEWVESYLRTRFFESMRP